MPIYCYTTFDGEETFEREFPFGKAPFEIHLDDGGVAERNYRAESARGVIRNAAPTRRTRNTWPMKPCVASGVNAAQAGELRDFLAKRGVPTEITNNGDPIYTSAKHRKKALKVRGLHDRNSFD